eukprot:359024-Lingulodinium_polyedra.AAC.1
MSEREPFTAPSRSSRAPALTSLAFPPTIPAATQVANRLSATSAHFCRGPHPAINDASPVADGASQ